MKVTKEHKERMLKLTFGSVYPMYIAKVERKGRTKDELDQVITWLTGYDKGEIAKLVEGEVRFDEFFEGARLNENATLIKGVICGYRIEDIEDDLVRNVRYLDKLVDELSKGKSMDKILR